MDLNGLTSLITICDISGYYRQMLPNSSSQWIHTQSWRSYMDLTKWEILSLAHLGRNHMYMERVNDFQCNVTKASMNKYILYFVLLHMHSCPGIYTFEEQNQPINHRMWRFRLWQNGNKQTSNFLLVPKFEPKHRKKNNGLKFRDWSFWKREYFPQQK